MVYMAHLNSVYLVKFTFYLTYVAIFNNMIFLNFPCILLYSSNFSKVTCVTLQSKKNKDLLPFLIKKFKLKTVWFIWFHL